MPPFLIAATLFHLGYLSPSSVCIHRTHSPIKLGEPGYKERYYIEKFGEENTHSVEEVKKDIYAHVGRLAGSYTGKGGSRRDNLEAWEATGVLQIAQTEATSEAELWHKRYLDEAARGRELQRQLSFIQLERESPLGEYRTEEGTSSSQGVG
ncbi:5'-3' exoribonuclease 4 [Platanthera guangdongensis]|uniref:5'-3' exoribonuclease 4 n=1 Tax=Platanthera guangdongensis TaxID=2320717 RepID=A0ABR2LY68_9ASPA